MTATTAEAILAGKRILVVEDEYFIAKGLARDLRKAGAVVLGPVPTAGEALALVAAEPLDGAVLDVSLRDGMAFPVADALAEKGVSFVFATGYASSALPAPYAAMACCEKPAEIGTLAATLFKGQV